MGDEYFANLDHIESVENFKEGYESEAHCSDSEGSGVDMSRMKVKPGVSSSQSGAQHTGKYKSHLGFTVLMGDGGNTDGNLSVFSLSQPKARAPRTATTRTTRTRRVKRRVTVQTTRLSRTTSTPPALCGGATPHGVRPRATKKVSRSFLQLILRRWFDEE